jgi:hypothetical protein
VWKPSLVIPLVAQVPFAALAGSLVEISSLLESRMIIPAYNHHARLLSSRAFGRLTASSLLGPGGADAVM